jgi:hypothetical protein
MLGCDGEEEINIRILFLLPHASGLRHYTGTEQPHPHHSASPHSPLSPFTVRARSGTRTAYSILYVSFSSDRSLPLGAYFQPVSFHQSHNTPPYLLRRPFGTPTKPAESS